MQGREEELQHEVRALQLMMERARLAGSAKAGSTHQHQQEHSSAAGDPLLAKYQAFKRQAAVVVMAADS